MIIYTKEDATIIIPCGLGPSVCPDVSHELQTKTVDSSTVLQHIEPDSGYDGLSSVTVNAVTSSIDSNIQADNIKKDVTILGVTGTYESAPTQPNLQDVSVTYLSNGNYTLSASDGYDGLGTVDVSVNTGGGTDWIEEARAGRISDISGYSIAELVKRYGGATGLFAFSNITTLPSIQDPVDNPDALVNILSLAGAFYNCKKLQSVDISIGNISGYAMDKCFYESGVRDVSIYVGSIATESYNIFKECFYSCQELRNLYIQLGPDAGKADKSMFEKMCCFVGNSSENENTTITINGLSEVGSSAFYNAFINAHYANSGGITVNLPNNLSTTRGILVYEAFCNMFKNAHLTGKTTPSFLGKLDYISGRNNFANAFANSDVETATLGFNTCKGDNNFYYTFGQCYSLKSVTFDGTFNVSGISSNFRDTFIDCNNLTSMTCTSTAGTKPFRDKADNNVASSAPYITDVTIDNVNSDVYLLWNPSVNAASVYGILSKAAGATVQEGDTRTISFYSSGLTVTDYEDGRIQTAYNAAVTDGWTINNLTITPFS